MNQHLSLAFIFIILSSFSTSAQSAAIDPELLNAVKRSSQPIEVLILLKTTSSIQKRLSELSPRAEYLSLIHGYRDWANRADLEKLGKNPLVHKIYKNKSVQIEPTVPNSVVSSSEFFSVEEIPYNQKLIKLDSLRLRIPSADGRNVLVGHIDTGVSGRTLGMRGKVHLYYDARNQKIEAPTDYGFHGTLTASLIVADRGRGDQIGLAPAAKLISAGPSWDYSALIRSMQFMADPDGNPATDDFPRVVSNSWSIRKSEDPEMFYRGIASLYQKGILMVFSGGNDGPLPQTITAPKEFPLAFVVGTVGKTGTVADGSSRGPAVYRGEKVPKPDLVAPGENIRAVIPFNFTITSSGASLAAPQVASVAVLALQANPALSMLQLRQLLIDSANTSKHPSPGLWDASYGFGLLDADRAVQIAENLKNGSTDTIQSGKPKVRVKEIALPLHDLPPLSSWQTLR